MCKDIASRQQGEVVETKLLAKCFVTLCRAKGKNFWLITKSEMKRSKCLSLLNANIDIDKLLDIWEKQDINEAADALNFAVTEGMPILTDEERISGVLEILDTNKLAKDKKKKSSITGKKRTSIADFDIFTNIDTLVMPEDLVQILDIETFDKPTDNLDSDVFLDDIE